MRYRIAQAPIGQNNFCYNSGVPPNYYAKEAEGKEDLREELTAQRKYKNNEHKKSVRDFLCFFKIKIFKLTSFIAKI